MNSNLTLVTALYDIKRGDLPENGFGRGFDHYIDCFRRLLKTELPMVIYCDDDVEKIVWEERQESNTRVVKRTIEDLKNNFPFFEQTNRIRQDESWRNRAGWIPDSPQSQLEMYNPLVMSKQFMLNDAAIFNFFDTKYFLWIDAGISNTIGDPCAYFTNEFATKITKHMAKMMYVCFPYDGEIEVHGFEKRQFDKLAGSKTTHVARGGMFGGSAHALREINDIYYQLLQSTLNSGYMGTEESIFTLITYRHPELVNIVWIENNGLIYKALQDIKDQTTVPTAEKLAIYTLTFNLPKQFELWVKSFKEAMPNEFETTKKYVINNSTDPEVDAEYKRLFQEYEFEEHKFDNIGICGGRHFAAKHFHESGHEYMIFFEDDMLLQLPDAGPCKSGFTTYHDHLFDKCIDIMSMEELDYLKLCFTEFYGDNHKNWAWFNVPAEKKEEYFPAKEDGSDPASTIVHRTNSYRGLPYALGEYHYCNWPLLFNKNGTYKIFLEDEYEHKYEQTWMSLCMNLLRAGEIKAASLLATTINHNRVFHYDGKTRRENEHYKN